MLRGEGRKLKRGIGNGISYDQSLLHVYEYLSLSENALILGYEISETSELMTGFGLKITKSIDFAKRFNYGYESCSSLSYLDVITELSTLEGCGSDGVFVANIVEMFKIDQLEAIFAELYEKVVQGGVIVVQILNASDSSIPLEKFWRNQNNKWPYSLPVIKEILNKTGFATIEGGSRLLSSISPEYYIATALRI